MRIERCDARRGGRGHLAHGGDLRKVSAKVFDNGCTGKTYTEYMFSICLRQDKTLRGAGESTVSPPEHPFHGVVDGVLGCFAACDLPGDVIDGRALLVHGGDSEGSPCRT